MNKFERYIYQKTLNAGDRVEIYDNFRQYLRDGVSAKVTFEKLIDNYTRRGKKPGDPIGKILTECSQNLTAGFTLAESFKEWIPEQELSIIASCDKAGDLPEGFKQAMFIAEGTEKISDSIKSTALALGYIVILSISLVIAFCVALVPEIKQTVPLEQWNSLQLSVWYFYLLVTDYWFLLLAVFFVFIGIIFRSISTWTGNVRFWFDKFPPYSIYKRLQGASFILNINAMLSAGIPVATALESMVISCKSPWLRERFEAILRNIEAGEENLGAAMDATGYEFPSEEAIIKMQSLFETSNTEGSLQRFAEKWLSKTVLSVQRSGTVIQIGGYFAVAFTMVLLVVVMSDLIRQAFSI
ncbi:type II secretion system F family protein [Salmonella enterica]|nr:type II secretion system F family protein [Salmonella enterica]